MSRSDPLKPRAKNGVVREPREADLVKDTGHFAQQINCDAVGFCQFDTEYLGRQHRPFGEYATLFGVGGLIWIGNN